MKMAIALTRENIRALSSKPGGFNRKQLEALGFSWPPIKGWMSSLIGKEIPLDEYIRIKDLAGRKDRPA